MKNILVVDDDKTSLSSALSVLSTTYKVTPVTSGERALKFLEKCSCDLVLLDINMPEMNGFEVLERIKQNENIRNIPVIFLTADNETATELSCIEAGAVDFITKPFVPAVVISRIDRILELEEMRHRLADKLEQKIQEASKVTGKSQQDALTGLWNRTYTENAINAILAKGGKGTLFVIDVDNFKAINNNYGHIEGDNILKMFADTMRKFAAENDILCRIGSDIFVMFINGTISKIKTEAIARDIISDIYSKIDSKGFNTNSSVSIGIAQSPVDGSDFKTIYTAADKALYYVKQNGKNSFHFFNEQREQENSRSSTLVDLKYLKDIMSREDFGKGAYQLDLESFHHIYNFIRRFVERSGKDVQTVLFTASINDEDQTETDTALEMLEQAIYKSLRRVDISTRYSSRQVIVILLEANEENGDMVAKRIIDCFNKIYTGDKITIRYDIAKMEGRLNN